MQLVITSIPYNHLTLGSLGLHRIQAADAGVKEGIFWMNTEHL